jgi:hypothetical protein
MPAKTYEPLTPPERETGVLLLTLISDWSAWAQRRTETIDIYDEQTVRRTVSVDFELPDIPYIETAPRDADQPIYVVPIGQMRKRPLRRFELHDEAGRTLPLMTAPQTARLAAATLMTMAQAYAYHDGLGTIPMAVAHDLWRIARQPSEEANSVWQRLGHTPGNPTDSETAWRSAIARNEELMALAYDLSQNRLLLVPMEVRPGERRSATFGYDEPIVRPGLARWELGSAIRRSKARRKAESALESTRRKAACDAGMGLVEIAARTYTGGDESESVEQPGLGVDLVWQHGGLPTEESVLTDDTGRALICVPAGPCLLVQHPPRGLLAVSPLSQTLAVRTGETTIVEIENRRIGSMGASRSDPPRVTRTARALQALGLRPHKVALLVPAIGHAASYHVEAQAPEGLQLSGCRLEHRHSYSPESPSVAVEEVRSLQRTHLHVGRVPQDVSGLLTLRLWPRPTTVAQAAFLASAITTILLAMVSARFSAIGPNAGSVATLLLFGTAPLSGYVARPREHRMTSVTIRGTRIVALCAGCAGIGGSLLVLLQRDWHRGTATFSPADSWNLAWAVLCGLALVAAVCTLLAARAWWRAAAAENIVEEPSGALVEEPALSIGSQDASHD